MGVLFDALHVCSANPNFIPECVQFFNSRTDILTDIVKQTKGGEYEKSYIKEVFAEVEGKLNDPDRGVKLIMDAGIPISKYKVLADLNKVQNEDTGEWEAFKVRGVSVPHILPSNNTVKSRYKSYRDNFDIKPVPDLDFHAGEWRLDDWLEKTLHSPLYSQFIPRKNGDYDVLEVIIRGDRLLACGHKSCFLLATLGNFGPFSKCVVFNSVVNFAQVDEKDIARTCAAFK